MAPRWTEDMTMKFLDLYKDRPTLWDQFSDLYKNKNARESALGEIVSAMSIEGFGITEAKLKIKALRATYTGEINKQLKSAKSGCSKADLYVSNVKWLYMMKNIMDKGTLKRESKSTLEIAPAKRTATSPNNGDDKNKHENEKEDAVVLSEVSCGENDHEKAENPTVETIAFQHSESQSTDTPHRSIPKRFKARSKLQQIANTARELKSLSANIKPKEESEHDIFGKHVAAQLSKLSSRQAINAIGKINSILTECRLQDLNDSIPSPYNSHTSLSSYDVPRSHESLGQSSNSRDFDEPSVGVYTTVSEALRTLDNSYSENI